MRSVGTSTAIHSWPSRSTRTGHCCCPGRTAHCDTVSTRAAWSAVPDASRRASAPVLDFCAIACMFLPKMKRQHDSETRPLLEIDVETRALLDGYGFDQELFEGLRAKLLAGELSVDANRVRGKIETPLPGDVRSLPPAGSAARHALAERGQAAIR